MAVRPVNTQGPQVRTDSIRAVTSQPAPSQGAAPAGGSSFTQAKSARPVALDVPQRHVALSGAGPTGRAIAPGPISLHSAAAQAAVEKSLAVLDGAQGQRQGLAARGASDVRGSLVPQRVEVDELGMTHVR